MIPENRVCDGSFPIPKLFIDKGDVVKGFMEEFKGFHSQFAACFSREKPRANFYMYMAGQMSQLERKSIEPIALNVDNAKVRAMQHFLSYTCMLAHFFLWHMRIRLGEKSTSYYAVAA